MSRGICFDQVEGDYACAAAPRELRGELDSLLKEIGSDCAANGKGVSKTSSPRARYPRVPQVLRNPSVSNSQEII